MATFTFNAYYGAGPAWTDISTNTMTFAGSGGYDQSIAVDAYQDETHITTGDATADVCTTNHCNNVKYLTGTTMSVNGGGSEDINDTNLAENECTLQVHFNHSTSVIITNARLYSFDGATVTNEAVGVDVYAFERGVSASAWVHINDDSGDIGGDNSGERLTLGDKTTATDHYWYVALSAGPESIGAKTSFDFGVTLTYS